MAGTGSLPGLSPGARKPGTPWRRPLFWVWVGILAFTAWFSAVGIRMHDAHLTAKADLGQMDLAIWNTAHGRFVQEIKGEAISTRLTDHVELIFAPVSAVFWLWDDVRALLVLQSAAMALAAWPIYLLARKRIIAALTRAADREPQPAARIAALVEAVATAELGALVFAAAYLLTPALEAAALAEFHALPLAAPCIAWALWALEDRRWPEFAAAALLLMSLQEGMSLLAAGLGIYALLRAWADSRARMAPGRTGGGVSSPRWGLAAGAAVTLLGLAWFCITTFVIIPHFAAQAYGFGETPYAARYGELGDSFGSVLRSFATQPLTILRIIAEPLRLRYFVSLLAPTALMALFGLEAVAVSLPLLLANLLSAFPFQYSGELHYSAPLVPFFTVAGVIGFARLIRIFDSRGSGIRLDRRRMCGLRGALGVVLVVAVCTQIALGYTPIGRGFWCGETQGWPQVTEHDRLLSRFAQQIPRDAALSATADLYPHLSHRRLIYPFPELGEAAWALADVAGDAGRHPSDIQAAIQEMLRGGWGVVDAADGYLLLAQGQGRAAISDAFYDFVRAPGAQPQHPLDVTFGDRVQLIGYDIVDQPKWRETRFRFYWEPLTALPAGTAISLQVLTLEGEVADDTAQRPMPALLWYPPEAWQRGETLVTETLPWYQPRAWAPALRVTIGGQPLPAHLGVTPDDDRPPVAGERGLVLLPAWIRDGGKLVPFARPPYPKEKGTAHFAVDGWTVQLAEWAAPESAPPGGKLPLAIRWVANGPAGRDYSVFVHLRGPDGSTVATGDAAPTWFTTRPTSGWQRDAEGIWVAYALELPAGIALGRYDLVVGWYDWQTGKRLGLADDPGNASGDEVVLGSVTVDRRAASRPDLACLLAAESCASQE